MARDPISGWNVDHRPDVHLGIRTRKLIVADNVFRLNSSAGDVLKFVPGFGGRVVGFFAIVETATTDADADGTLTLEKNGSTSGITGGVITLADTADGSNPTTPANLVMQSTAITAFTAFDANDYLNLAWAVTNAFSDGVVRVFLILEPNF